MKRVYAEADDQTILKIELSVPFSSGCALQPISFIFISAPN